MSLDRLLTVTSSDDSVLARTHRRARAAALHPGPSIGLAFDPVTGSYRIAVSRHA